MLIFKVAQCSLILSDYNRLIMFSLDSYRTAACLEGSEYNTTNFSVSGSVSRVLQGWGVHDPSILVRL